MTESRIILKPGREKPVINQHPWVFSGAIRDVDGYPQPGEIVSVRAHDGAFLGRGYWNASSQIRVRLLTWDDEPIDDGWWRKMLKQAIQARSLQAGLVTGEERAAYRLVNAENDFLPGLIVDRYGDWLVMQALTLGIDTRKVMLAEMLADLVKPQGIYERSDVDVRAKEGLEPATGVLRGIAPPERIEIHENGRAFVDVYNGHKTGYYLDQAVNRALLLDLVAAYEGPCHLLNLFSYTGGFSLAALAAGRAHVVNVDASYEALELAEAAATLNQYDAASDEISAEYIQADVFEYLRDQVDVGALYDIVVLDPPKFAHSRGQVESAARGYKDINLHAFQLVRPGGYLMTFSCSGAISADLFQKIVFGALVDSGRQAQILQHLGPSPDHPVALTFPEGAYLKGLLLRVV